MNAVVVYESMYGNTHAVAEAIADGLGGAPVLSVHDPAVSERVAGADLLVAGGPTHVHGMTSARTRQGAVDAVHDASHLEPDATEAPGLREWLEGLAGDGRAAAFDTRADKPEWLTGAASRGIAKRLRRHGYDVVAVESFLVTDTEGPLVDGELDRARSGGRELARAVDVTSTV
jgi:hypothetical protein